METHRIPNQFASIQQLGKVRGVFLPYKRNLARLATLGIFVLGLVGLGTTLVLGVLDTYERYYRYGPAVVTKNLLGPGLVGLFFLGICAWAAWIAYANWDIAAAVYDGGFTYSDGSGVQVWPWKRVSSFRAEIQRTVIPGIASRGVHRYRLEGADGKKLILDDRLERVETLADLILEQVTPRLLKAALHELEQGREVTFGPIRIQTHGGLCTGGKRYAWDDIADITLQHGMVKIQLTGGPKNHRAIRIPAAVVPNLEVLFSIVDRIPGRVPGMIVPNPDSTSSSAGE